MQTLHLEQAVPDLGLRAPARDSQHCHCSPIGLHTCPIPPNISHCSQGDPSTRPLVVQSPLPVQGVLAERTLTPQRGGACALALPFLRAPSWSKVTRGVIPAGHILSPAPSDNTWLSKAWLERHQSSQTHCQPFLQGGEEQQGSQMAPAIEVPLPPCPAAEGEQRPQ